MSRPTTPDWATSVNYPAGSDDWSGQPNKVEPSAGKKATGFVPDTDVPAEEVNWLLDHLADWIDYHDEYLADIVSVITTPGDFHFEDEFLYPINARLDVAWVITGAAIVNVDFANGASGVLDVDGLSASASAESVDLYIGNSHGFRFATLIRHDTLPGTSDVMIAGLSGQGGDPNLLFQVSTVGGNYLANVNGTLHDTGVAPLTTGYQLLEIRRSFGNTLEFLIDHGVVWTQTYATALSQHRLLLSATKVSAGGLEFYVDKVALDVYRDEFVNQFGLG